MNLASKAATLTIAACALAFAFAPPTSRAEDAHGPDDGHGHGAPAAGAADAHAGHDHGPGVEHHEDVKLTGEAINRFGIATEPAMPGSLRHSTTVPARVSLNNDAVAHVGTTVEGRITELRAKVGDKVAEGDVLFVIESPPLGEAQGNFLEKLNATQVANVSVEVAKKAVDRAQELGPGKGITISEFQTREGNLKLAMGALLAAQGSESAAKNRLRVLGLNPEQIEELAQTGEVSSRLEIRAALGGEVIEREITLGENVGPDRDSLMVIADLGKPWVLTEVPEGDVARLRLGSVARVSFDALPGIVFDAEVTHIASALNSRTRSGTVRLALGNSANNAASAAANCEHHLANGTCPFCDPELIPAGGMCVEHAVPEALCHQCSTRLVLAFKAQGDWCVEHDWPESQCAKCNPSVATRYANGIPNAPTKVVATSYSAEEIERYKAANDWCGGHGLPESKCLLCNPELADADGHDHSADDGHDHGADDGHGHAAPAESAPADLLRPGMFGQAEIQLSAPIGRHASGGVLVPATAIQRMGGAESVFVELIGTPGTFRRRPVAVGDTEAGFTQVLAGLDAGDSVVASGAFYLKAELGKSTVVGCCATH